MQNSLKYFQNSLLKSSPSRSQKIFSKFPAAAEAEGIKFLSISIIAMAIFFSACKKTITNTTSVTTETYTGTGSVTKGVATATISSLYNCTCGRVMAVGSITSTDEKTWIVPAENDFATAAKLPDLSNKCNAKTPTSISQVYTASVPVIVIDADGEIITGYIYGDNYFELYVNGKLVGVDAFPYTLFNSCFVKFKVKRPIKYAVKLVDWEDNLSIGTELNAGDANHPGDGDFIAKFSDGTVTSLAWKAQTYYIAPLSNVNCVTESGTVRTATLYGTPTSAANSYALHWTVPSNWYESSYDFIT